MSYTPANNTLDFQVWSKLYLPTEENKTPIYNYKMVDFLFNTDNHIKNIKSFRGSAKSITTCKLALYRVVSGMDRYVLIVSDTALQGEALIADIAQMIQFGNIPNVKVVRAIAGEIELLVDGKPSFILSKGAGSSMRGIKRGSLRATLCLTDDLMNDQVAMNRLRMARLEAWYFKVLRPSLHPRSEIWNIGTPLNQGDIFMKMCSLHPTFDNPLTEDSWPDRFTPEWIERTKGEYREAGQLRAWKQEMELILTDDETAIFDMKKLNYVNETEVPDNLTWYITLDGAFSEKDAADFSAFACLGLDTYTGKWYVASYDMKEQPQKVIDKLFNLQEQYQSLDVGIEKGAFLLSMQGEITQKQLDYQQYFTVKELSVSGSKISRIKALAPVVNSGRVFIIDTGTAAERLVEQMELTDGFACNASHDDNLDAMAQLLQMDTQIVVQEKDVLEETGHNTLYEEPDYGYMFRN